jgi:hypothetical protein
VRAKSAPPVNAVYISNNLNYGQAAVVPGQPFWLADANEPGGRVINPNAFPAPAGFSGNFPRNALRGVPLSRRMLG